MTTNTSKSEATIDRHAWNRAWQQLCVRWNRKADPSECQAYREYLERQGLDTTGALAACETLWATREFFPRPSDFLLIDADRAWSDTCNAVRDWLTDPGAARRFMALPDRTRATIGALGGPHAVHEFIGRDYLRAHDRFHDAFVRRICAETLAEATVRADRQLGARTAKRTATSLQRVEVGSTSLVTEPS